MSDTNYICDMCGADFPTMEAVNNHLQEAHDIADSAPVGSISQEKGILTMAHSDGEEIVIDLAEWVKDNLSHSTPQPTADQPELTQLVEWQNEGGCQATDGCWVETDGTCIHGHPSWLLRLGLI